MGSARYTQRKVNKMRHFLSGQGFSFPFWRASIFSIFIFVLLTMSPLNVAGRCVRRPPSGQASPEGPPLQSLYATMIKCTAVHSYMVKGEDARRKLKTSVSGPGKVECPEQMQISISFGFKIAFGKVWTSSTWSQYLSVLFQFPKKRGQPGTRYDVAVIPGQRQKSARETQRPRQAHQKKSRVPGKILSQKNILLLQIIVDAEARQILGGASGAKSSMRVSTN